MPLRTRYKVRTIFLAKYFEPARDMAEHRSNFEKSNAASLIGSMKRVEIADAALEKELNNFADKGFTLTEVILHPNHGDNLMLTAIFSHEVDD